MPTHLLHGRYPQSFRKSRPLVRHEDEIPSMIRGIRCQSVSPLNPSQFTLETTLAVSLGHGHE